MNKQMEIIRQKIERARRMTYYIDGAIFGAGLLLVLVVILYVGFAIYMLKAV